MDSDKADQIQGVILVTTKVQKWGNSLAVRIPSTVAESLKIHQGSEIELSVNNQAIILRPIRKKPTLEDLVSKITPENRHAEIVLGTDGRELL